MKPLYHFLLVITMICLAGCSAIAGIFKAGVWTGILIVAIVIGIIIWIITRTGNKE